MRGTRFLLWVIVVGMGPALGAGQKDNNNPVTRWCDLTAAERDCICNQVPCFPEPIQTAINALKGEEDPDPAKPWKSTGSICKQKLETNPGDSAVLGRTLYDQKTGAVKGVVFPPPFFGAGAGQVMWKKVAVRQEANRVSYGNVAPIPYQGVGLGAPGFTVQQIIEVGCWKAAFQGVNNGLSDARDAQSRASMIDMTPPAGVTAAAWKDFLCKQTVSAAQAAIDSAKRKKERAQADAAKKKALGPGNDPNATKKNLNDWIKKLCKEIAAAEAALAKAKEHCK